MYYRRTKTIAIGSALLLGLGALTLIPADPARVAAPEIKSVTSAETVATIDAMLGAGQATTAPAPSMPPPVAITPLTVSKDRLVSKVQRIDPSFVE